MKQVCCLASVALISLTAGCSPQVEDNSTPPLPMEVVDLGALITEDLTVRVWGERYPRERGYDRPNDFEVINWQSGPISGSNAYYTLFNHGGPHVDAPIHMGFEGGLDSYPAESFAGPLKVFDVSNLSAGPTIGVNTFADVELQPGDVVLIYTGYTAPTSPDEYPSVISLSPEAVSHLASIPIRAFGTDAWSVDPARDNATSTDNADVFDLIPAHASFLSRQIPVYEQLFNLDQLIGKGPMYFVGQPLNIANGDGMMVRPFVLVY